MTTDSSSVLSSALSYLGMGLSVFPLAPKDKKPLKQFKWEQFQSALPTKDQVGEWFEATENNVAIVTGDVSRLLAFDVDGSTAKIHANNIIQTKVRQDVREALSSTLMTETGGVGLHILVRYNPDEFQKGDSAADGIKSAVLWRGKGGHNEIRLKGNGGYIVAPPSVHPSGAQYKFISGSSIAELSKEQILDLISSFRQVSRNKKESHSRSHGEDKPDKVLALPSLQLDDEIAMDVIVILRPYYFKGQRHEFVLYLSGWLRKEELTIESARKVVEGLAAGDEELPDRLTTVEDTYSKDNADEIMGYAGLVEILQAQTGSLDVAHQILREVESTFPERASTEDAAGDPASHGGGNKPPSASEIAIDLVDRRAELYFNDEYGTPHIRVQVGEHTETMPVGSSRFELFVSRVFYDEMDGQVLKAESLNEVVRILTARTVFDGKTARLHLRSAWGPGQDKSADYSTLYLDPATQTWSCIKVTTVGWEILPRHPDGVLFTRFKQLPQVTPVRDYPPDVMERYLDLMHIKGRAARLLVKVLLIASFIPDIGHPITVPNGEQGGVKSTYCRYHKRLVDPCAVELLTIPKDRNEFVQHMHHNYVVVYDNVRIVPSWFSDEICKAVTGAGNSKRRLYTDDEDVAYNYKRCILVNGINNVLTEPDALDRSVMLDFTRISDEQRREEAEVDAEFDAMKPALLGYILDILAKALSTKPTVELARKPRMADFAVWGEAIARAMDCKELEFVQAYYSVLERQNVDAVEATLVGPAIVNFVCTWAEGTTEWEGSPDSLLGELRKVAEAFRIDTRDRTWPKKGNSLTRKLKPLLPDLRQGYNIDIIITRDNKGEKTKSRNSTWMTIERKIPPTSPTPPHASAVSADGEDNGGGSSSVPMQKPPPQNTEKDARVLDGGGSGDGGDIFRLTEGGVKEEDDEQRKAPNGDWVEGITAADDDNNYADNNHTSALLGLADSYTAFDLEWTTTRGDEGNSTIYAAAFVHNDGNNTVLHISDFGNSEPRLLQAITEELLRHPVSVGWYTTGMSARASASTVGGEVESA
jgi:hypothetical protein